MLGIENTEEFIEIPEFVSKVLWNNIKTTKKRGINNNSKKPLGLTKICCRRHMLTHVDIF